MPPLEPDALPSVVSITSPEHRHHLLLDLLRDLFLSLDEHRPTVLVNTFDALEHDALRAVPELDVAAVGPVAQAGDADAPPSSADPLRRHDAAAYMEWLDTKPARSVVYVSFGSVLSLSKRQEEEMRRGLDATGRPYLWVARRKASGDGGEVKGRGGGGQLVPPSLAPATSHKDAAGGRTRPPSRNALSAIFQREDEGARAEQAASSFADQSDWRKGINRELVPQAIIQESCGALLEITNEIQIAPKNVDSVHQKEAHSGCLPAMSDDVHSMEALKAENCETPRSHQCSTVPDAMSSSKTNDDVQSSATSVANNVEDLTTENNTEACVHYEEHQALDPAKGFEECGVSKEDFLQPEQSEKDPKCAKNDNLVAMEISISDEYSLFQSSEGSVSSSDKIRDSVNTPSMEKSLETETKIHATRKKVLKNNDSELDLPSLSHWLKPPNPKKPFRDEALTGDMSHSAKSSDEDRPIVGMVAAHWKDKEPANFTPKWFDGNGIPNSTNKYKEDQKVSWHATPFEERLEKALSEEKLLSERNCSSGRTSQFLGVEGEESDTAESNRLYAAAFA